MLLCSGIISRAANGIDSYELVEGAENLDLDGDGLPDPPAEPDGFFSRIWPF